MQCHWMVDDTPLDEINTKSKGGQTWGYVHVTSTATTRTGMQCGADPPTHRVTECDELPFLLVKVRIPIKFR